MSSIWRDGQVKKQESSSYFASVKSISTEIQMINEQLLDECIEEYNKLKRLDGLTEQQRGQKFNALIAKVLNVHQIDARANQRSLGEIDVIFRIKDKRFLLEAKWEKNPTNINPITKLTHRINQRIPINFGAILSMSGYTRDALRDMSHNILLLEQDVFDALLHANFDAEDMFDACIDVAAFEGRRHITLSDIFKYLPRKNLPIEISSEIETESDKEVAPLLEPKGNVSEFKVLKTNLPFGQNGISVSDKTVFVTLIDGLYELHEKGFNKVYNIDNPQNRCVLDTNKKLLFFVINGSVMAVDTDGIPVSISKRYPGHVRIFESNSAIHLFSSGTGKQPVRVVEDIAGVQREIVVDYPVNQCVDACFTEDGGCAIIGSAGLKYYQDMRQMWSMDVGSGAAVSYHNGKILFLENSVSLKSVGLDGESVKDICHFNLSGSDGDFAIVDENEYIFHLYYNDGNTSKSAVVYVKTG